MYVSQILKMLVWLVIRKELQAFWLDWEEEDHLPEHVTMSLALWDDLRVRFYLYSKIVLWRQDVTNTRKNLSHYYFIILQIIYLVKQVF